MIFDAIVSVFAGIVRAMASLLGVFELPGWFSDVGPMLDDIAGAAAGYASWIPVAAAVNALTIVAVAIGIALAIRIIRIVVSLFTGGGGGAA